MSQQFNIKDEKYACVALFIFKDRARYTHFCGAAKNVLDPCFVDCPVSGVSSA